MARNTCLISGKTIQQKSNVMKVYEKHTKIPQTICKLSFHWRTNC